ncbi:putative leucine-rich repeat-containing protein DDB_G0290503 isoform X1 [Halyomorpha halys]|uniref:putative leucine-rich repeat-containing protein DDB_G0290503 isoform X1 n=1 Tax=Halyomorpha halys TaxID=286706 RepID=UPI0006D50D4D|nr:uncharacterized protein LOC106692666 isoform X1 [Halyomorpha halys]
MAKKRNVKANADEEDDRSCRESSSDGSVLDNPVKNGKSRKCKAQAMNKASNNLTNKSSSITKHLSESSCDSVACINGKEVSECNLGNRDKVTAPDDTNVNVSEQSVDPIENNSQEPIPDNKELIKTNSDKYSELITLLGGKEGDIDTFIKQYTIWQQSQSNTGKQIKAKKNATKSPTLQKPMKLKATRGTPLIKLTKKSISKKMNKNSDKKSPIPKKEDLKEPDSSFSEIKSNNTDSSCSSNPKDSNTIIKSGDSDEVNGQSNVTNIKDEHSMAEDIADCSKDVLTDSKPDAVHSKMKSKSLKPKIDGIKRGKKKPEVLSKEEVPKEGDKSVNVDTDFNESSKCTDDTKFNESSKHTDDTKFNESSKHTDDTKFENNGSKEIKVFDQEDQHATPKILNEEEKSVSECEDKLENDLINNDIVDLGKEDLVHEGEDKKSEIFENNSFLDITGSDNLLQGMIQENNNKENDISISDSSDNNKENDKLNDPSHLPSNDLLNTNQSICDKSLDSTGSVTQPCLNSKSQPSLSPCNIENNQFDEKDKAEDEVDTSAVLNINNSVLIERDSEIDIVWKRKRRMSDEKNECSKRTKRVIRLSETKTDEPQYVVSSSEPTCNKWNTEESNSFFEELIYSDEEKINNFTDNIFSHKSSMSVDEPTKGKVKNITLKSDLNKNTEKSNSIKNNYFDNKKSYDNPEHSKSVLDKKSIENSNGLKNNSFHKDINFDDSPKHSKGSSTTENMNTPHREINKEWKKKKCIETRDIDSSHKSKSRDKDKVLRISSKSKKQMKSKERTKSKKSSLNRSYDLEDLQKKDDLDKSYESMLKKVKKQLKTGRKSILETDLPVVEVSYKGESLHGILGSLYSVDFLTRFKLNQERQTDENILSSSHAQGILIRSLRPLCSEMLRTSSCKDPQNCRKEHKISNDFFSIMDKHDAWLIVAFILRISNCLSENLLTAILEFLSKYKAKRKILLVSRHVFQSHQNNYPVVKSLWEDILIALELCGLQRWEGIRSVIQFILDTQSHPKAEVFHQMLKIWNVHGSSFSNTWQIVEPLVTGKIIVLQPLILSKLMGEIIAVEPKDKVNIYRLLVQQLTSLTKDNFNQISYRLLNDFLRKVSQEGLHSEEKLLREIMNSSYQSPFYPQQSPLSNSSLRRCRSLTNLTSISSDSKFHLNATVHEEEKMEAAMLRALQCSNYDSVIKVIIASYKKVFINKVLLVILNYVLDKNSYNILKNIFIKLKTSFGQYGDEIKDIIGNIVVTLMLDYVKQYDWKEANNYFNLLEEYRVNKYKLKSLSDGTLRPVRLAVVCSEIHYYNGRYKESIGVFINARLIDPDSEQWAIPGGNKEDYDIIAVMIVFLLNELIKKKIINIATMLFKAVIEAQSCLNEPIEIGPFFESLLYGLFELTEEYPETAVKLYMRVIAKDSSVTLYGLTYRALIILAYRTHKRAIIKDIFYKAIEEYVYPIIEGNENVIMLLRSLTEEEIIVYILEWVARFKEKQSESCDHEIQIKFKDAVLEDFLDNKVLGIPALLKEVDQTLPGALKRLDSVLKRLHIVFKQIKKDTFSVDPLSFQKFLNKIKVL